jgi:hypothetical protein
MFPVNPSPERLNLESAIGYICVALLLGGALLWFATDFDRRAQAVIFTGQCGLAVLQYRAWRRSKRDSKQPPPNS